MESSRLSRFGLVLLALVTLGWGLAWPINKWVLAEVPPLTFRGTGLVVGALGVLALARAAGQPLAIPARFWGRIAMLSLGNIVGWNALVIYGIQELPSGRAALLGYTMPLWSTLLSVWLLREPLTARRVASLVLGMAGIAALLAGELAELASAMTGVLLMLGAAVSWAIGTVLLKRYALPIPTAALTGWMMLIGSVPIAAGALLEHDRWQPVSALAVLGVAYSAVVGLMFGYWAWNRLVLMVPVAVSSVSSLATPVIGVASGMWLLDEPLTWHEVVAGACILGAIALVMYPRIPATADDRVSAPRRSATAGRDRC